MGTKEAVCPNGHTVHYMTGDYIVGSVRCLQCHRNVEPKLVGQAVPLRWGVRTGEVVKTA